MTPSRSTARRLRLVSLTFLSLLNVSSALRRAPLAFASIPSNEHESIMPGDVPMFIEEEPSPLALPLWKLALAGGLATVIGDAAFHPVDCVKTLQQSDQGLNLSLLDAARVIFTTTGPAGFYKGLGTYVLSDGIGGAFKFATYEKLTHWCREKFDGASLSIALLVCAAMAFLTSSIVLVPGEFLKQQLQVNHYDSLQAAFQGTLAKDGLLGLYAGYDGVCLRDIPYTVLELGLYDAFKRFQQGATSKSLSPLQEIAAAALAGGITAYATTPLDTIKTKLMVDAYNDGFLSCFLTTLDQHGLGAVFAGGMARVVWIVPFTALYLPVYEWMKRKLSTISSPQANTLP